MRKLTIDEIKICAKSWSVSESCICCAQYHETIFVQSNCSYGAKRINCLKRAEIKHLVLTFINLTDNKIIKSIIKSLNGLKTDLFKQPAKANFNVNGLIKEINNKPIRDKAINNDDLTNLKIALGSTEDVNEFLKVV